MYSVTCVKHKRHHKLSIIFFRFVHFCLNSIEFYSGNFLVEQQKTETNENETQNSN